MIDKVISIFYLILLPLVVGLAIAFGGEILANSPTSACDEQFRAMKTQMNIVLAGRDEANISLGEVSRLYEEALRKYQAQTKELNELKVKAQQAEGK